MEQVACDFLCSRAAMNSASCCLGVRISGEHWPTSNLQDLQERVLYFEEGKAGKYGRGDGKDEEEMKDQLALLRKLAKGVVWCSVYTCVTNCTHSGAPPTQAIQLCF